MGRRGKIDSGYWELHYEEGKLERGGRLVGIVLNIHTPLSPTLTPIFLFAPLQSAAKRKLFLGRKNIGWGYSPHHCSPLPLPMLRLYHP